MSVIVTMEADEDVTVVPDGLVPQTVDTEVAVAETVVVEVRVRVLDPSPQTSHETELDGSEGPHAVYRGTGAGAGAGACRAVGLLPQGMLLSLARLVQVVAVGKHLPKLDQVGLE